MKKLYQAASVGCHSSLFLLAAFAASIPMVTSAQGSCPMSTTQTLSTYPNTYYPANQNAAAAGSTTVNLGAVTYGSTPISSGDVLLIIQMQGAQINSTNTSSYGDGTGTGRGYLSNSALIAGRMEYVMAANSVPLTGGTLQLSAGLSSSYQNSAFGTDGQYTYQVIRVPLYYNVTLAANISAPRWDGRSGGVIALFATNNIDMASYTLDASGLGFRGGGGRAFSGAGSGTNGDFITPATSNANGGKGEGIAGTPKYLNNNNSFLDVSSYEGYPNGSYGKGAPANAGGGGTDGNPASNNDENTGGGGGGNGGMGGGGGKAWSSAVASGGRAGAPFAQASPSRLVMGGGGGAGTTNNGTGSPGSGFASSGAAGGGIIIVSAGNSIIGNGTIKANGSNANITVKNDGSGGGGAGGSVLVFSKTGSLANITVSAKGGNGGNNQLTGGDPHGPGGGGGGGVIYSSSTLNPSSSVAGGTAGITGSLSSANNYGAAAGTAGSISMTLTQAQLPAFPITCLVLPVEFLDITAARRNEANTITWRVGRERDVQDYLVERSSDGRTFTVIGHLTPANRVTATVSYTFTDNENIVGVGRVYYRVRQTGAMGASQYSRIVSLQMSSNTTAQGLFPNPARTSTALTLTAATPANVSIQLVDIKGTAVWRKQAKLSPGQNIIVIDHLGTLPNGIYLLQWFDGLRPQQVKLLVDH